MEEYLNLYERIQRGCSVDELQRFIDRLDEIWQSLSADEKWDTNDLVRKFHNKTLGVREYASCR